jgi:hypothetical protein
MALQLQISTDEIAIRYRQPYVSEALNRKASSEDSGVQKGFIPSVTGAMANAIKLLADEVSGTSVMNLTNSADKEFTVTWIKEGDFEVTVPAVAQWHHLFVDHGYEFGTETTPTMTWYTDGEVTDPAVIQKGIYLCSALGVAAGQNVTEVKTLAAVGGSGLALKRSTSSTALARTRVRGYNEEPVFFTDFGGASMSPVDLTPGLTRSVTAKIINEGQTFTVDGGGAGNLNLVAESETGSHSLILYRSPSDTDNSLNGSNTKHFALPAYVPVGEDPEGTSPTRTLRVAVRFKSSRNFGLRFAGTNPDWSLSVNFAYNHPEPLIGPNGIGANAVSTYEIRETLNIQSAESIVLSNQANGVANWSWGVAEFAIPNTDSGGNYASVTGASLVVTIPDMIEAEYILIDRVLVESDVSPSTHGIDGHRTLTANAIGRFASYSPDDGGADTLITPSAQGIAIAPAGGIRSVDAGGRVRYALEGAGHSTSIGLPLIDESNDAFFDYSYSDRSIERRDNTPEQLEHLINLFKQSNVIVNAPGAYDTGALIDSIEAAGGTVGEGLRAPLNAGITVNDGNVFAKRASHRLNGELVSLNGAPNHLTGHVVAYGNVSEDGYYIGTVEDGVFVPTNGIEYISGFEANRYSETRVMITSYYENNERTLSHGTLDGITVQQVFGVGEYNAIPQAYRDAQRFHDRIYGKIALGVVDSGRESLHSTLGVKDSPIIGVREDIRAVVVGSESLSARRAVVRPAYSQLFDNPTGSALTLDSTSNALTQGAKGIEFTDNVGLPSWTGEAYLAVGVVATLSPEWASGVLTPADDKLIIGQFCDRADLLNANNSYAAIAEGLAGGSRGNYVGLGLEIRHTLGFTPVDSRSAYSRDQYTYAGEPSYTLDSSTIGLRLDSDTGSISVTEIEGQRSIVAANLVHYLTPLKSDGSDYTIVGGVPEPLDPNGVFLFEALQNPAAYPNLSPENATLADHFRQPVYELTHRVMRQDDAFNIFLADRQNQIKVAAQGRLRVGVYDFYCQIAGVGTRVNATSPFRPVIEDPASPPSYFQFRQQVLYSLNGGFVINSKNTPYWWAVNTDVTNEYPTYAEARDALIASEGATFDIDYMNNDEFRHEFQISLCYDSSFRAASVATHPISLIPVVRDASFAVHRRKL